MASDLALSEVSSPTHLHLSALNQRILRQDEASSLPSPELKKENIAVENRWAIASCLIIFSFAGVLIRLGLVHLHTYEGSPVFPLICAQFVGCAIMGAVRACENRIIRRSYALYVGLSTGLCGSITTFSSWQFGMFTELANMDGYSRGGFQSFLAFLAHICITLGMSLAGLLFGDELVDILLPSNDDDIPIKAVKAKKTSQLDLLAISGGVVLWTGMALLAGFVSSGRAWSLPLVMAPLGTLFRWVLALSLNNRYPIPLGTLVANILGTALLAAFIISRPAMPPSCEISSGLIDGFCGCLTTISTFIVEITTLPRNFSCIYAVSSIVIGQVLMIVIVGGFFWSGHTPVLNCNVP
ncbi:uncharacterized protein VTP21DRAFT_7478 [Calcarisporiella thermophila]|uniref:uncharacterized protein n=1 Tax=Calcarisporiella thermophila TaxID=911321 RepID=UPI003743F13E